MKKYDVARLRNEKLAKNILLCSAVFLTVVIIALIVFMGQQGLQTFLDVSPLEFFFSSKWNPDNGQYGAFSFIFGSLLVTFLAILVGGPIGVMGAVFMAKLAPKWVCEIMKPAVNLYMAIPSVVYGFFGLVVLVPFVRDNIGGFGMGVLTASILLGLMILPTIISVSEAAIRAVPRSYYAGGLALGASHERSIFFAVLPAAKRGILASVILGIGRAIGETMAVIMVAGNQAVLPDSLTSGVRTMTTNIVMEMGYSSGLHREALIGTAVVLFIFVLIINISFSLLHKEE